MARKTVARNYKDCIMKKYLYNFEQQPWREVRQRYFDLLDLVKDIYWLAAEDEIGGRMKEIVDFLNSDSGSEEKIEYSAKHALSIMEIELVDNFIVSLKDVIRWSDQRGLGVAGLRGGVEDFINKNIQLSEQDRREIGRLFSIFDLVETELDDKLKLIIAVIGGPQIIHPYTFEEFGNLIFENVGEVDNERLLVTLSEAKYDDKNGYKFVRSIVNFLLIGTERDEEKMEWEESFILFAMLDVLYHRFSKLTGTERWFVLQNYFYKAIVCGLPVKNVLQNYLRDSDSTFDHLIKCSELKECLANNKEKTPINLMKGEKRQMVVLLNNYVSQAAGDDLNGYKIEEFAQNLYKGEIGRDAFVAWLREVFLIVLHVNSADLIDWDRDRNFGQEEVAAEDKVKLLFYVGFGGQILRRVVDYFRNKKSVVSLGVFIKTLKENFDLGDEKIVERILDFIKILKENGLFGDDKELIEFHESDGKFHWNEELFK